MNTCLHYPCVPVSYTHLDVYKRQLWRRGSEKLDRLLYNGQYFQQRLNHSERYKYQIGDGCLSDQLFGQTLASLLNLGYILPQQHIHAAVCSIYENNFRKSLEGHFNVQRAYALQQEGGLLMCTWPHGGRPKFPFPYCDEVWTGVESVSYTHLDVYKRQGSSSIDDERDRIG